MNDKIKKILEAVSEMRSTAIEEHDHIRYECPYCKIGGHNHLHDCPIMEARRILEEDAANRFEPIPFIPIDNTDFQGF